VLPEPALRRALHLVPLTSAGGPWTRALGYHLLQGPPPGGAPEDPPQPLWPGGPIRTGARFNLRGSFGSVYLASDPRTALDEVEAILERPGLPAMTMRTPPWVLFAVEGFLEKVLDLTQPAIQSRLGTSLAELTGDWRFSQALHLRGEGPLPPTQLLGQLAYESGRIGAIKYHSAKNIGQGFGFVVFSDRLHTRRAGFLEVYDPHERIRQRLP